jgi:hypothetical protein
MYLTSAWMVGQSIRCTRPIACADQAYTSSVGLFKASWREQSLLEMDICQFESFPTTQSRYFGALGDLTEKVRHSVR